MMETGSGVASEDRVAALEKKFKEMEALVKGLTQELLDLKSIVMKMSKQTDERSRQELKKLQPVALGAQFAGTGSAPSGSGNTVVMRPKSARQAEAGPETPKEPEMDMIMQTDGTMKLEARRGEPNYIVARAGYGRDKKGSAKAKQSDLIYAAEEQKKDPAKK